MKTDGLVLALRPHFWLMLALFLCMAAMVATQEQGTRFLLFVACTGLFVWFLAAYGLEYDAFVRANAKKKKKKKI